MAAPIFRLSRSVGEVGRDSETTLGSPTFPTRNPRFRRLCDIDRRFVHVSERASFRCGSGERHRWASLM